MYAVVNPASGQVIREFPTATDEQIRGAIQQASDDYSRWRLRATPERAALVKKAAQLFEERAETFAQTMSQEMGKRIGDARGEMGVVVDIFNFYADNAEDLLKDDEIPIVGGRAVIRKAPIGVILGIMPWNYPVYQVARFAAPNLVLGNTVLLKHAPICPATAIAIEELLRDAGFPAGAYVNVFASNDQVKDIIAAPSVQGVSLTGSERAGSVVASEAGRHLKKVVLELGGSDPMVVLDTEDLDALVEQAESVRLENMGQACNAPKRMIVAAGIYDSFVDGLVSRFGNYAPGDPSDPETTLAPLSSRTAAERVVEQIETARSQGATVHVGGQLLPGPAAYVTPAVITDVTPEMNIHHEEVFGPVAIVYKADTEEQALELANDTPYGLGSSVFSSDNDRAVAFGQGIDAGMVYINTVGGSQADVPFGGVKRSGVGRELGFLGIEEFMNKQVVRILDQ